jgi:tRNA 2-thiouridine synthesizing protein A
MTQPSGAAVDLDLRGEVCPYTFLKTKLALEEMALGTLLRVVVDNEASVQDVPRSLRDRGHAVVEVVAIGPREWAITVRRG